jgi:hypothetical protein
MPKPRFRRAGLIILAAGVFITIITGILLHQQEQSIRERLCAKVRIASGDRYSLTVGELEISLLSRQIILKDFLLAPTDKIRPGEPAYLVKGKSMAVSGYSLLSFFFGKKLVASRMDLSDAYVKVYMGERKSGASPEFGDLSIYKMMSSRLGEISIHDISVNNCVLSVFLQDTLRPAFSSDKASLILKKFLVNKKTDDDAMLFGAEKCEIGIDDFTVHLMDSLYALQGKRLSASYLDKEIRIDSLVLAPLYPKHLFSKKAGRQISRAAITLGSMVFAQADVRRFIENNSLEAKKLYLKDCYMDVYRDDNYPLEKKRKPSFQRTLRDLPFYLHIDSVQGENVNIVYDEVPEGSSFVSRMLMEDLSLTLTGLDSDTLHLNSDSKVLAVSNSRFMEAGKLELTYLFPLNTDKENFTCEGKMGGMPLTKLNPLSKRAMGLDIKEGMLDSIYFKFKADDTASHGTMTMLYHDLKIDLVDVGKTVAQDRPQWIKSFLLNAVFDFRDNPKKGEHVRTEPVFAEHNPSRYFLFYTLSSVGSGVGLSIFGKEKLALLKKLR